MWMVGVSHLSHGDWREIVSHMMTSEALRKLSTTSLSDQAFGYTP